MLEGVRFYREDDTFFRGRKPVAHETAKAVDEVDFTNDPLLQA